MKQGLPFGSDERMVKVMNGKRIRKSLGVFFLCAIIVLSFVVIPVGADSGENSLEPLTVGVPADRCPIFYEDPETGEVVGIGADLMRYAAEEAGYDARIQTITEPTLKDALDNNAYDVLMPFGSAITSASGKATIVSDNLFQTPFTFVTVNREIPPLDTLRVGMLRSLGGGIETLRQLFPEMEIVVYDTMSDSVKALRSGEVDALLHNSYVWSYVLQKPAYSNLTVQPSTMFSMDFRAGTLDTPEGRTLIDRLNGGIASLTDPRRQAIVLDYTSRSLYQYDFSDYLYRYGPFLLIALVLIALLIIIAMQRVRAVRMDQEEKMRQLVEYDSLTGLLSLNGFRKRVEELLRTHPDTPYFLSYNNIRDFKFINDSLGREAGDALLKFWAERSTEFLSEEEAIGRVSADHFVVLRKISGEEMMRSDERNVLEPVRHFFIDQGKETRVQICSGIYVLTPKDFRKIDVDHMLDLARVAEQKVRESRKGDFAFYNPEQWDRGKRIADIINYLPGAMKSGDIQVWYQPQVNYRTGKVQGAEALCRWDHTKLGWLHPAGFIDTLEEAGLIYDLDCFVWETVCKDLKRWNEQGFHRSVSVNVSRDDISEDRDLSEHFLELIQTYGLSPDQLRIEITETAYVENTAILISTTEKLRSHGFQVEMDDFGSGYSSLHMLKEVPVDRIKLDLYFLTETGDPQKSRTIVSCIINMVNLLGMEMIAEGVETVEQADFLSSQGCSEMQGYYFYKPMPVSDLENILEGQEEERTVDQQDIE